MVATTLNQLRAAGFTLAVEGRQLKLTGSAMTDEQREQVSQHKADIIAMLLNEQEADQEPATNSESDGRPPHHAAKCEELIRNADGGWSAQDWQAFFDERAGIAEFDGGLSRPEAEASAFACCVAEMMNRTLVVSDPDRCVYCGGDDRSGDRLLPFVATTTGHTWLHPACWESWFRGRQGDAAAALAAMGIGPARKGSR